MKTKKTKRNKGFTTIEALVAVAACIGVVLVIGWVLNIYKLATKCDFDDDKSTWKAEIIRTVGIPVPPLGGVVGFMNFDEEK